MEFSSDKLAQPANLSTNSQWPRTIHLGGAHAFGVVARNEKEQHDRQRLTARTNRRCRGRARCSQDVRSAARMSRPQSCLFGWQWRRIDRPVQLRRCRYRVCRPRYAGGRWPGRRRDCLRTRHSGDPCFRTSGCPASRGRARASRGPHHEAGDRRSFAASHSSRRWRVERLKAFPVRAPRRQAFQRCRARAHPASSPQVRRSA